LEYKQKKEKISVA